MIDPTNITNFNRTQAELEEFLLFCVVVAGKNSKIQARKLSEFIDLVGTNYRYRMRSIDMSSRNASLFRQLRTFDPLQISWMLQQVRMGQYKRITDAFIRLANQVDPAICSLGYLEATKGIGPKTARFFLLHSRPNQRLAVLDTHILKYIAERTGLPCPKATPQNRNTYRKYEQLFLRYADESGLTPAEFDLNIWKNYANKKA